MDKSPLIETATHALGMFVLLWLSGQATIEIPVLNIPITLQSFAVIIMPLLFGQATIIGLFIWLIAGIFGLPVFANGACGLDVIFSNSGGFILGFLVIGFIATLLKKWALAKPILNGFIVFTSLQLLLMAMGMFWIFIGNYSTIAFDSHIAPYLPGLAIKSLLGSLVLLSIDKLNPRWI